MPKSGALKVSESKAFRTDDFVPSQLEQFVLFEPPDVKHRPPDSGELPNTSGELKRAL